MAQSGNTFAQVSSTGGSLSGTLHVVTTDGAGPYTAIIDPTGTGAFASGTELDVTTQVPGTKGNIKADGTVNKVKRALMKYGIIAKRAANVNKDYVSTAFFGVSRYSVSLNTADIHKPFAVAVPAGTTCSGTVGGQANTCLVKLVNPSNAGPFGGVFAVQMAGGNSTTKREVVAQEFSA